MPDFGLEQRGGESGFQVRAVICPIVARVVLDGIVKIPDGVIGGADKVLHGPVFE